MPGLFQLPEYAELVIRCLAGPEATDDEVRRFVELRMERQRVLAEPGLQVKFETIINESALRAPIGGAPLRRRQLLRICEVSRLPQVEVRVLPSQVWLHAGVEGSFWLFRMPRPYPAVAFLENLAGQMYVEEPRSNRFRAAYDRIRETALDPVESTKLIASVGEELG